MAQYYQVQPLSDEMKQIYTTDIVLHVSGDDGQIHLDEGQPLLLQNDQVVYQTQGTPTQYQPPQAGTHYTILGEDMNQPQAQQVLQQQPQQQQQPQAPPPPQHQQQQQVLIHQQQQQQTQQHQVMDIQQHQMQTAYQMSQDPQQHMQAAQEHQMQQVQPQPQQQTQQLYYATDQLVHQQQQKKVYIQQAPPQAMQQQYQPHPQQQTHQQMLHQQPPPPPPQQQQQHILQSPQHQQVQVQHQVSPSAQQQQPPPQIIYTMQSQQPAQILGNAQLIVQQPSRQQVLIQQQPQQQELIMRQQMPQQRVLYNNQRVMYAPQQTAQQQQQQTIMQQSAHQQQQHIHLQTNVMHHNPTAAHLVQQARVVPAQHQQQHQQVQQQTPPPPTQQQQMQQSVVYHQIQVPKQNMSQTSAHSQQQQHIQLQQQQQPHPQQQQQPQMPPNGATIIRAAGIARGGKIPRGALIARMPGGAAGVPRAAVFNASGTMGGGGGQTLRTPRPRCSTSAGGTTARGRGGRAGRGAAAGLVAGRGVQVAAAAGGTMVMASGPQLATLQQAKIVGQGHAGIRQVYRTQLTDGSVHQQVHLVQSQPRMPGTPTRFRSPSLGVPQQQQPSPQQQQSPQQSSSGTASASSSSGGNFDLDLEDSIQAVFVKKDGQKQASAALAAGQAGTTTPNSGQIAGTTLTTYINAKDDEDSRLSQNGSMTLAEYKKRNASSQIMQSTNSCIKPLQQTPGGAKISVPAAGTTIPVARVAPQKHIVTKEQQPGTAAATATTATSSQVTNRPPAGSSVYQTSHNNYEIQTQHVLQNRAGQQMAEKDRNSAKMLVILVSGEQRLITFTLPRESCTVQDLLEQVGVPFDDNTTIQCVENPGANIDFVVTVGFSVQESASELISRAEQSLQISRQQESLQQNSAAAANSASSTTNATTSATESPAQRTTASTSAAVSTTTAAIGTVAGGSAQAESSAKEQQSTAAPKPTSANSVATKATEEPAAQRKLIQGFYAICQICGFSGYDHSKCERCKRVFLEPPKKVAIKQATTSSANMGGFNSSSSSGSSDSPSSSAPLSMDKKRHGPEGPLSTTQRGKTASYNPNGPPNRGRGGSQSTRGRGTRSGRRPAEVEPVILTLSSDEEDDESSNKGMANYGSLAKSSNSSPTTLLTAYKPLAFEPNIPDTDEALIYNDFKREDVTDLSGCADKLNCSLPCKLVRLGSYRFEPPEPVIITSKGIRIVAPLETNASETFPLHIHKQEVVKIIAHFSKSSDSMLCFYTLRNCAEYIRTSLKMPEIAKPLEGVTYFTANGPNQMRKIIIQFQVLSEQAISVIRSIWDFLDEISDTDAQDLLQRAAESDRKLASNKNNSETIGTTTQLQPNEIRQLLIYPPGKGGISINTEDFMCLATDQYLNDIIIDFYLKWVHDHIIPEAQKDRTHIFSTFFYKRLTTLTRHIQQDKDVKVTAAQKRHARVQNWTKNVNLFEKDFVIIPINEQSHWFLAIICFPRLKGPVTFETGVPVELQPVKKTKGKKVALQIGNTTITPLSKRDSGNVLNDICGVGDEDSERDEAEGDDSDLASEDSDFENSSSNTTNNSQPAVPVLPGTTANTSTHQAIKQPLILIFDSLAGASRSRVVATLRDYLSCEYKIKMPEAPLHTFNKDNMPGHCVKVPQQNNFTDCGLYLLQYVEQFFKDPIRDYRVPIKQLANWFDTLTVTRKREDISNLLQKLMNDRNGPNNKVILPEIPFPTLNGQLVEPDGFNIEFEEEEMEDDDDEENQTGDMDDQSTDDTSKSKTPIKMPPTPATTTSVPTMPALVPTQARKIVLKRRMQISGASGNECSPQSINNSSNACTTTGTTPTSAQGQQQRTANMSKMRKVDP